jgi:hypothetical protein
MPSEGSRVLARRAGLKGPSRDGIQREHQARNCRDPGSNYSQPNNGSGLIKPVAQPSNATTHLEQWEVCTNIAPVIVMTIALNGPGSGVETMPKKTPAAPASIVPGTLAEPGAIAANEEAARAMTSNARSPRL